MGRIKIFTDFGSTFTKTVAFDMDRLEIAGRVQSPSTVDTDVTIGLENALAELRKLVPFTDGDVADSMACSSAAGGLKMVCVGLVPEYTTMAGRLAALGAGAKVAASYSYELSSAEISEIEAAGPDIVLLTGGTDGGNRAVIIHNAQMLAGSSLRGAFIVAGNKSARDGIEAAFSQAGKEVYFTSNVMPEFGRLRLEDVNALIRELFIGRITRSKGVARAESIIGGVIMPTPAAVLAGAAAVSSGTAREAGLGELLAVDVGGATTDVCSVAAGAPAKAGVSYVGLPEPYSKRTVEGDLGLYHNLDSLLELAGEDPAGEERLRENLSIPRDASQADEHLMLSALAVKTAVDRHAGRLTSRFTSAGEIWIQQGKDLRGVKTVIATGGPLVFCRDPKKALSGAAADGSAPEILKPASPEFFLDSRYILFAVGLLSGADPDAAVRIFKKHLTKL